MKIAVLSLTRDRLDYTRHCFQLLHEHAGCDYDHYVLDQASTDGTVDWLFQSYAGDTDFPWVTCEPQNIGIHRGLNKLIDRAHPGNYDVIVKFDPDCELLTPDTIRVIAELAARWGWLVSPTIHGLNHPPPTIKTHELGGWTLDEKQTIGGICMAIPAWVFNQWRFDESLPPWGGDDIGLCSWLRGMSGHVAYVRELDANHYETTEGQKARYPEYFSRKALEGSPL